MIIRPDEYEYDHVNRIIDDLDSLSTTDVMSVIERSDNPDKMQKILEKYWRKI